MRGHENVGYVALVLDTCTEVRRKTPASLVCLSPPAMILFLLTATVSFTSAIQIDNGVVGLPQVDCMEDRVALTFNTEKAFNGRIFVKGMADDTSCVTSYTGNSAASVLFEMRSGECNMRRQRRLGPQRGVEQSMTVIISFHGTFITKVDRGFRCTCFFMEADKVVTSRFDVSMIPTTDLIDTARMPLCTYGVRRDSISGPPVSYARVGDMVYHVWECDSDMFGMLVHSCFVDDGAGQNKFLLTDQNGCAIDPVIMQDLNYNQVGNMAFVEAHVFKFADRVTTYFQCAVSLCMKADGACNGLTPPNCSGRRIRTKRETSIVELVPEAKQLLASDSDLDVAADKIIVLDIDDQAQSNQLFDMGSDDGFVDDFGYSYRTVSNKVCLSSQGFGLLVSACLIVTLSALASVFIQQIRARRIPALKP